MVNNRIIELKESDEDISRKIEAIEEINKIVNSSLSDTYSLLGKKFYGLNRDCGNLEIIDFLNSKVFLFEGFSKGEISAPEEKVFFDRFCKRDLNEEVRAKILKIESLPFYTGNILNYAVLGGKEFEIHAYSEDVACDQVMRAKEIAMPKFPVKLANGDFVDNLKEVESTISKKEITFIEMELGVEHGMPCLSRKEILEYIKFMRLNGGLTEEAKTVFCNGFLFDLEVIFKVGNQEKS